MIPSEFPLLEKLPLTPNGRFDRKALPLRLRKKRNTLRFEEQYRRRTRQDMDGSAGPRQIGAEDDFFACTSAKMAAIVGDSKRQHSLENFLHAKQRLGRQERIAAP
jgi:hypothetical protein